MGELCAEELVGLGRSGGECGRTGGAVHRCLTLQWVVRHIPQKKSALYSSMDSSELRDELQKLKDSGGWAAAELRLPRPAGRRGQNGPKVEAGARKTKRPVNPKGGTVQVHRLHISSGTWFTVSTHFGSNSQTDSAANRTPGPISDPRPQERCPAQVCNPGLVRAGNGSLKFSY